MTYANKIINIIHLSLTIIIFIIILNVFFLDKSKIPENEILNDTLNSEENSKENNTETYFQEIENWYLKIP